MTRIEQDLLERCGRTGRSLIKLAASRAALVRFIGDRCRFFPEHPEMQFD